MSGRLESLRARTGEMVEALRALVSSESPSENLAALSATAAVLDTLGSDLLGRRPQLLTGAGAPVLRWELPGIGDHGEASEASEASEAGQSGEAGEAGEASEAPVLLLAHYDTVWPLGTLDRWPFSVTDGRATGPGAFDMKAGLVQSLFALATPSRRRPPVVLLVTSDEEIGSPYGQRLVEDEARRARAALVLEASVDGKLKTARKGVGNYRLEVTGRAAHAGLEPERGINALSAAARLVLALPDIARSQAGTTVTPTLASAGSAQNTVPATASVAIDVRAGTIAEQQRVDRALRSMEPGEGASLTVQGGINRPPLEEAASAVLFELAVRAARRCGIPEPGRAAVGGGSDGNFTAALGVPTLDGLGAVGAGAHAEGEYVVVAAMPERAALLAEMLEMLSDGAPASGRAQPVERGEES
jgi:glutamate carboxypeptidase